ncbi:hypothetical protein MAR_018090 [Mya arenaria]|uniref:Uncharacterized protein n=1 Tax=Mya arenaria TaxID=6604 RepID=A0ABY7EGR6_MYAAR|nr:hypothetical protein MAR_018090 [Mya arenaria]
MRTSPLAKYKSIKSGVQKCTCSHWVTGPNSRRSNLNEGDFSEILHVYSSEKTSLHEEELWEFPWCGLRDKSPPINITTMDIEYSLKVYRLCDVIVAGQNTFGSDWKKGIINPASSVCVKKISL